MYHNTQPFNNNCVYLRMFALMHVFTQAHCLVTQQPVCVIFAGVGDVFAAQRRADRSIVSVFVTSEHSESPGV